MKKEVKLLRTKAIESLVLSIEHFNRPSETGRVHAVLMLLDHAFEMLFKAIILHRGGRIREPRSQQTIGFDACVRKGLSDAQVKFLDGNPTLDRRARVIARLEEQKLILKYPNYIRTIRTWVKKDGQKMMVEKHQRVAPWWRAHPNGTYALFVRSGLKPIEFEKGKTAIAVPSLDKIPSVIDTLIAAIRAGELDAQLAQTKQGVPKSKAA
jgi:hypothetical protein